MKRPDIALIYIAKIVFNTTRPPLASHLAINLYLLISQLLLSIKSLNPKLDPNEVQIVQHFIHKSMNLELDFDNLDVELNVKYCEKIIQKLKTIGQIANSGLITPYARPSYAFDDVLFEPHFYKYRVDLLKQGILGLVMTCCKFRILNGVDERCVEEFRRMFSEHVAVVEKNENCVYVVMEALANHFEAVRTISPTLVLGLYSHSIYAFLTELLRLKLPVFQILGMNDNGIPKIIDGLSQASQILLLTNLNSCKDCVVDLQQHELHFQRSKTNKTIPCRHRFTLKLE